MINPLRKLFESPWKAFNELNRICILPFVRLSFWLSGVRWGSGWKIYGLPIIQKHRQSHLEIGARFQLRSNIRSNPLGPNHPVILSVRCSGSSLIIKDDFGMTGGSIIVDKHVEIGNRVLVGANTIITDTDFHPLHYLERQQRPNDGAAASVIIEDDVFIGTQSLILKGVRIGMGSVIGAGSVVTKDVPPGAIVAGNPARIIREL